MPIAEERAGEGWTGEEAGEDRLPASMADLFFALVALVIFLLLALVPAIGAKSGPPPDPDALWRSDLRIEGRKAAILLAGAEGLRLLGSPDRRVPLDAILDDPAFGAALKARAGASPLLLAIEEDGQEAAFLFDALAASLDLAPIHQVRIDGQCGEIRASDLERFCGRVAAGGAAR